jgi:hypothetical protein
LIETGFFIELSWSVELEAGVLHFNQYGMSQAVDKKHWQLANPIVVAASDNMMTTPWSVRTNRRFCVTLCAITHNRDEKKEAAAPSLHKVMRRGRDQARW